ncbi:MAG: sugar-binding protein, partial [Aquaticitalea sp.]
RNGQTDIVMYDIANGTKTWICSTEGGEYSPLKIPDQSAVSAIRLDPDGKQLLYSYDLKNGTSKPLMDTLVVGYHNWFNPNILLSSVLAGDDLFLYKTDINEKRNDLLMKHVGRSLHNIPNSKLMSFISKENDSLWEIKSIDPISGATRSIIRTLPKTEDMCWTPNGSILMAKDGILYRFTPNQDENWIKATSLLEYGIKNISRMAVSPDGKKIAIVADQTDSKKTDWPQKKETQLIQVEKAKHAPSIDGIASESIWKESKSYPLDQLWLGKPFDSKDFQGNYKICWRPEALYLLVEITDDVIFEQYEDPLKLWWDDDCVEVFIDEDNSGGEHQFNYNAFAYHVALDGNVLDMSPEKTGKLYNQHVQSMHITAANTTIWELKISVYDDTYSDAKNNKPVTLKSNKKIGFALAYCDNDGSVERENFIGSIKVEGEDKNRGWIDANIFGTLLLKN